MTTVQSEVVVPREPAYPLSVGQEIELRGHKWEVEGIHLGDVGQESLIQLKGLSHSPGWTGPWEFHPMIFVPEIMLSVALAAPAQLAAEAVADTAASLGVGEREAEILCEAFSDADPRDDGTGRAWPYVALSERRQWLAVAIAAHKLYAAALYSPRPAGDDVVAALEALAQQVKS